MDFDFGVGESSRKTRRITMSSTGLMLAVGMSAFLSACGVARNAGDEFATGAVARVVRSDASLMELQRTLADSASALLSAKFADAVLVPARATWAEMRQGVRDEGDSLAVRMDAAVTLALTETIPMGLDRSALRLEERFAGLGRAFAEELVKALAEGTAARLQPATDSLVASVIVTAVRGIEADLEPALHSIMLGLRDSLEIRINDVDQAVAGTKTMSALRAAFVGGGSVAFLGALVLVVGSWRRKGKALDVLIEAIERGGDKRTKQAVGTCAQDAGVDSWLHQRVRRTSSEFLQRPDPSLREEDLG